MSCLDKLVQYRRHGDSGSWRGQLRVRTPDPPVLTSSLHQILKRQFDFPASFPVHGLSRKWPSIHNAGSTSANPGRGPVSPGVRFFPVLHVDAP